MSVYRQSRAQQTRKAPEQGPVTDMVRQFADPHAFLRELVQNAIDAGATTIQVRFELVQNSEACFSVSDDGCGMDRNVIEGPLLTLFRSSKEGVEGKIGRYGVGFISVFAIEPESVVVLTSVKGEGWRLVLRPDYSYELEQASDLGLPSGTTVSVYKRLSPKDFETHAQRGQAALCRWCRQASCAIHLTVVDVERKQSTTSRIDVPFLLRAPAVVLEQSGSELVVVGPTAGTELLPHFKLLGIEGTEDGDFAGFYNRGLTLCETDQVPMALRGLRYKVLSPRLQHTISRDDVRRDEAYESLVERVHQLARERLTLELERRLREEAELVAGGGSEERYAALLGAASSGPYALAPGNVSLALVEPLGEARTVTQEKLLNLSDWPIARAAQSTTLSRAFAADGRPVLRVCSLPALQSIARLLGSSRLAVLEEAFTGLQELEEQELEETDHAFCDSLRRSLTAVGASLSRVTLARCEGATGALAYAASGHHSALCYGPAAPQWWKGWRRKTALWLDAAQPLVKRARQAARFDAQTAAGLFARLLLLRVRGVLEARAQDRLLASQQEDES